MVDREVWAATLERRTRVERRALRTTKVRWELVKSADADVIFWRGTFLVGSGSLEPGFIVGSVFALQGSDIVGSVGYLYSPGTSAGIFQ